MSNYVPTGATGSKPCCSSCSGGAARKARVLAGLGDVSTSGNIMVYGVLAVGGFLWLMHKVGKSGRR